MSDADTFRSQKASSTDPRRLEREASRVDLAAAIDYMTDIATSQHAWDHPIGRHYHTIVAAAQAHLATARAAWKPIDDTARDGNLWPVARGGESWSLARYSDGKWRYLVKLSVSYGLLAPEPAVDPTVYFDIPEAPVS